mmetsp:Transcript_1358/g.1942  ORF Transcript_1358/g.1942 Transcript_1358/m.1942 type:complete len:133 (-) Transcript_1358:120-518(-)
MPGRNHNNPRGNSLGRGLFNNHHNRNNGGGFKGRGYQGNNNNGKKNQDQREKHIVFKYKEDTTKEEFTNVEFILPGETKKKKVEVQVYKGKSFKELVRVIAVFWDVIDEYDLMIPASTKHKRFQDIRISLML